MSVVLADVDDAALAKAEADLKAVGGAVLAVRTVAARTLMSLVPNAVAAETFAATSPRSNRKLAKDLQKLLRDCPEARVRYVFFAAPGFKHERQRLLETVSGIGPIVPLVPSDQLPNGVVTVVPAGGVN
jgi:hypothetical protein